MNALSSISISGMNVAQTWLQTSAHNIANLNTQDFRRQELTQSTLAEGGVRADVVRADNIGSDLETDMVQQLQARNSFLANLKVFKIRNAVLGSLLDISA